MCCNQETSTGLPLFFQLTEIENASSKILNDLSAFSDLQKSLLALRKDVQEYRAQQWELWLDETRAAVSSKQLRSDYHSNIKKLWKVLRF